MNQKINTKFMVRVALLSVISFMLMTIEFPIPFMPPWLKLDISEIPVLLAGYSINPVAGVLVSLIKNILHFLLKNNDGTIVGELAAFLCGVALVLPSAIIYRKDKSKFILSLIVGSISMVVCACILNYFVLLPVYAKVFGMPLEALIGLATKVNPLIIDIKSIIFIGVAPFNMLKCIILIILMILLYKKTEKYLTLS